VSGGSAYGGTSNSLVGLGGDSASPRSNTTISRASSQAGASAVAAIGGGSGIGAGSGSPQQIRNTSGVATTRTSLTSPLPSAYSTGVAISRTSSLSSAVSISSSTTFSMANSKGSRTDARGGMPVGFTDDFLAFRGPRTDAMGHRLSGVEILHPRSGLQL